jgi:hypothetical protein
MFHYLSCLSVTLSCWSTHGICPYLLYLKHLFHAVFINYHEDGGNISFMLLATMYCSVHAVFINYMKLVEAYSFHVVSNNVLLCSVTSEKTVIFKLKSGFNNTSFLWGHAVA